MDELEGNMFESHVMKSNRGSILNQDLDLETELQSFIGK